MHRGIALSVKHYLRDPCSIAQVDKHDRAVIPPLLDPPIQHDGLPDSSFCKFPAPMSSDLHTTFAFLERAHPTLLTRLFGLGACIVVSSAEASF